MKKIISACAMVLLVMTSACGNEQATENVGETTMVQTAEDAYTSEAVATTEMNDDSVDVISVDDTEETKIVAAQSEEETTQSRNIEVEKKTEDVYVGEYKDYDTNEPNLKIKILEDGSYSVQITIYRLTTLEDGVGELTEQGLEFQAIDAAGNPIGGIITREGDEAVVTFTDSTWELIENGTAFWYYRN